MRYKKILVLLNELDLKSMKLNDRLYKHKLLLSNDDKYYKKDKESFKKLWIKYIEFFVEIQRLIKLSKCRRFIFFIDYNKLLIRKYLLVFYFNLIVDLEKSFGNHSDFIRKFLQENFKKDFSYFSKYIYKAEFINLINTPNVFIKAFSKFIDSEVYKLFNYSELNITKNRIKTDFTNFNFSLKTVVDSFLFFISKNIGYLISITRFTTRKKGLIKKNNLDKYLEIAKVGDILLTRGNWNASNISIPGFWKHMSMYVGRGDYLMKNFNKIFKSNLDKNIHYIIESHGEGVVVREIEKLTYKNDYLGVSRTNFKKEKITRVLKNSFDNIGKGYDFRFYFHSDKNLVCSELIMKSYAKEFNGDEGIDINLENIGLSLSFPPNNFVDKLFEEEKNGKDAIIKPVFFIDSIEKTRKNFISTKNNFIKSRKRSRFTFFLK